MFAVCQAASAHIHISKVFSKIKFPTTHISAIKISSYCWLACSIYFLFIVEALNRYRMPSRPPLNQLVIYQIKFNNRTLSEAIECDRANRNYHKQSNLVPVDDCV